MLDFSYYGENTAAYDNRFSHLTVRGAETLVCSERENYGNVITGSILSDVKVLEKGSVKIDLLIENSAFWLAGFSLPVGPGNITADPLWVDAPGGDYHLQVGSPCIGAASSDKAPADDREGIFRPQGDGFDQGAHEFDEGEVGTVTGGSGSGNGDGSAASGGSPGGALGGSSSTEESSDGAAQGNSANGETEDSGGCGCHLSASRTNSVWWWLAGLFLYVRRVRLIHRLRFRVE